MQASLLGGLKLGQNLDYKAVSYGFNSRRLNYVYSTHGISFSMCFECCVCMKYRGSIFRGVSHMSDFALAGPSLFEEIRKRDCELGQLDSSSVTFCIVVTCFAVCAVGGCQEIQGQDSNLSTSSILVSAVEFSLFLIIYFRSLDYFSGPATWHEPRCWQCQVLASVFFILGLWG